MTSQSIELINVFYETDQHKQLVGRLALNLQKIYFEYDSVFLKSGLQLSPFKLPLQAGVLSCSDTIFGGLFGVFYDSLPDGWGRLLLDRKLTSLGIPPNRLTALDRLCYVGAHGMGALSYEPNMGSALSYDWRELQAQIDELAREATVTLETEDFRYIDTLLNLNGSSGGARPKIMLKMSKDDWIIKFRSMQDPIDNGPLEYAYHLMARAAGLRLPTARLFPSTVNPGYFGVQRFDRIQGEKMHMHSLAGLLHADYRLPSLDYETIFRATLWLTKDIHEVEVQFRAAIFNVLSHNRDDHAKNFSFLMDPEGKWTVSPAYDLIYSSGPAGEHSTTIMGEGNHLTEAHLLKLATAGHIAQEKARDMIDEVKQAISEWPKFSKEAGVGKKTSCIVQKSLRTFNMK